MAQDFSSMRYVLTDGQATSGSVDGLPQQPCALYRNPHGKKFPMKCWRMKKKPSLGPNYDGSEHEPLVLPTRFPHCW